VNGELTHENTKRTNTNLNMSNNKEYLLYTEFKDPFEGFPGQSKTKEVFEAILR
jgi:hypothetical protein